MLLLPGAGWAKDYILEKAYWTDSTASASFEQAQLASYTPYANLLSKGFSPAVQWVRLKVEAIPAAGPDSLVLRIRPHHQGQSPGHRSDRHRQGL